MAALLLAGPVAAAGCSAAAPPAASAPAERAGLPGVVRTAVDDVELADAQRATALQIVEDLRAGTETARAERRRVAGLLADRIARGTLARADVDAALADLARADAAAVPAIQDAANRMHGALDAEQREELLEALREAFHEAREEDGGPRARLRQLAEELDLTDDQRDAIRAAARAEMERSMPAGRERFHEMRERAKALAEAFVSEEFDAAAAGLGDEGLALRRTFLGAQLRVVQAALPTLSPAQREKLAAFVRARGDQMD